MPCIQRVGRTLVLAVAPWLAAACDDSTGNSGSLVVTLSSPGLSVTQGGSGTTSVVIIVGLG